MRKRNNSTENQSACRFSAARLLLFACVFLCGGFLLFEGIEALLAHPVRSAVIRAQAAQVSRALPAGTDESDEGKININSATAEELQRVPGIGPALSQRILDARDEQGGFHFLEEIMDVPGIGEKRFAALKELFYCPLPGNGE